MAPANDSASSATEWLIDRIHEYGFDKIAFIIIAFGCLCAAIGYVLSWLLSRKKLSREIEQFEIKNRAKYLEVHQSFQTLETQLSESNRLLNDSLKDLLGALESGDETTLRSRRNELCEFYSSDFITALHMTAQRADIVLKPQDQRRFVMASGIPRLIVMRRFAETINHPRLLSKLGNPAPYQLSTYTCNVLKDILLSFLPRLHLSQRLRVSVEFRRLKKHCRTD